MHLAVGYWHRSGGGRFSETVLSYPEIEEVYFPWVNEPSGRPLLGFGEEEDEETLTEVLQEELTALRGGGRRLDLLLNANCYGRMAASLGLEMHIRELIGKLDGWGCKPDIVTTASPFIAATLKKRFPEIEVRASVNMRLMTLQAMKYLAPWFDSYYIGRDVQRNLDTVRRFSDWARGNGKKVGILANSGCLRNCPWQTFHDNLVAHSAAAQDQIRVPGFNPHLCWTMYARKENLPELLKATWIRPEDLPAYEPYVDFVKLATRQHACPRLVIDAYVSHSFKGNLPDLFEPGFSPAFSAHGTMLDNSRFPKDWAQKVSACSRECTSCGYCEKVFDQIQVK
ncbi:MAG: hypothetical protein IJS62_08595 [Bacteroidales bacterium]|nr:hypothetical protein [Bacteroidales bacterium]